MFEKERYATPGVTATIPPILQLMMWATIDFWGYEGTQLSYFQFFHLSVKDGVQIIRHFQEEPPKEEEIAITVTVPVTDSVYVVDDGEYAIMLLASEY